MGHACSALPTGVRPVQPSILKTFAGFCCCWRIRWIQLPFFCADSPPRSNSLDSPCLPTKSIVRCSSFDCRRQAQGDGGSCGNSLLYFLITPLCVKVNCNVSLQLTFTQFGVKIYSMQNAVNFYTKWCNPRLLVATANFAMATACSVTRRSLHGPGSNFCHPPAHGAEIYAFKIESL